MLQLFGIQTASLVAVLGATSLAIGLALQGCPVNPADIARLFLVASCAIYGLNYGASQHRFSTVVRAPAVRRPLPAPCSPPPSPGKAVRTV
ncbi:mechanosensitive ion channel [Bradyrhizobium sp. 143]|uniref:mechanosensitive ion channel n=1 Tax=Bradyrhizobium sp. 143 TaxID=2782619 RepID=UPI001FFB93F3